MRVAERISICLLVFAGSMILLLFLTKNFVPEDCRTIVAGLGGYITGQMTVVLYVLLDD